MPKTRTAKSSSKPPAAIKIKSTAAKSTAAEKKAPKNKAVTKAPTALVQPHLTAAQKAEVLVEALPYIQRF